MKDTDATRKARKADANRQSISGTPGVYPFGAVVGATGGAVAGAAIGAVAGPVGAVVGLVAGAVAGCLAGRGAPERISPTVENEHPKAEQSNRPYAGQCVPCESYRYAYRTDHEIHACYPRKNYEDVESHLR